MGGHEKPGGPFTTREKLFCLEVLFDRLPRLVALVASSNVVKFICPRTPYGLLCIREILLRIKEEAHREGGGCPQDEATER
jgi:hypothetical protein